MFKNKKKVILIPRLSRKQNPAACCSKKKIPKTYKDREKLKSERIKIDIYQPKQWLPKITQNELQGKK